MSKIDYKCSKCGASEVKLWRQYQTFADYVELLCLSCAEKDQDKKIGPDSDQIGYLVPAVPDRSGEHFWGYTSASASSVAWWYNLLPEIPNEPWRLAKVVTMTDKMHKKQKKYYQEQILKHAESVALMEKFGVYVDEDNRACLVSHSDIEMYTKLFKDNLMRAATDLIMERAIGPRE